MVTSAAFSQLEFEKPSRAALREAACNAEREMPPTAKAKPAARTTTSQAKEILEKADGMALKDAIGELEGATEVTVTVLACLGSGTAKGKMIRSCKDADDEVATRVAIVKRLLEIDTRLVRIVPKQSNKLERARLAGLELGRRVTTLVDKAIRSLGGGGGVGTDGSITLVNEDEKSYTMSSYTVDEMKDQLRLLRKMYNITVRQHELPTLSGLKKIVYAIKIDECFPDPLRVTLESMRRDPSDKPLTLWKRIVYGTFTASAGVGVKEGTRDDGAGWVEGFPAQWFNAELGVELTKELEEVSAASPRPACRRVAASTARTAFPNLVAVCAPPHVATNRSPTRRPTTR